MKQIQCKVSSPDLHRREPREIWRDLNLYLPWRESKKWGRRSPILGESRGSRYCRSGGVDAPPVKIVRRGGGVWGVWGRGGEKKELQPLFHPRDPLYHGRNRIRPESPGLSGRSLRSGPNTPHLTAETAFRPESPVQNLHEHQFFQAEDGIRDSPE